MIGQPIFRIIPRNCRTRKNEFSRASRAASTSTITRRCGVTKDGKRVDISLTISPLHDKAGKVIGASKVARDITERKRSEEMQSLLLGELNHRVKNTLAIVQSIAAQTLRRASSPKEFAASFSGRVQALARAHTLFTRDSWKGTDITDLVHDQLMLDDENDNRISWSGPPSRSSRNRR